MDYESTNLGSNCYDYRCYRIYSFLVGFKPKSIYWSKLGLNNEQIYFCLKQKIKTKSKEIEILQICDIFFIEEDMMSKIENVTFQLKTGLNKIDAMSVVKILSQNFKNANINNIGDGECYVVKEAKKKGMILRAMLLVFAVIILFFGGAITIINFHADVNMPKVHENVYRFFGGEGEPPLSIGIFYSLGLLIGFVSILSIFSNAKKNPGLLDLELFKHDGEVVSYKKTEKEKEED